jgi:hypothetical protein
VVVRDAVTPACERSVTDTSVTAAGQVFVSLNRGQQQHRAKSVQLDDLAVR